jgi:hypothetical protein
LGHNRYMENAYPITGGKIYSNILLYILDISKYYTVLTLYSNSSWCCSWGPPLLLSACVNTYCQDPSIIPPLLKSFLSPLQPTGILFSSELLQYLLSFNN